MTEKRDVELHELSSIMQIESGRNVLRRLLNFTGINTDTFNPDPIIHSKNAGRREVGIWLRNEMITASKDLYIKMMKEDLDE